MPVAFTQNVNSVDLHERFVQTVAVAGSPALAAETIIATFTNADFGDIALASGVRLHGWCSFTMGTSGTAATMRIRQTNVAGTVIVNSGPITGVAASLFCPDVLGFDAGAGVATYALTLQITAGAAVSTVSAVMLAGEYV